jgi:predicted permease
VNPGFATKHVLLSGLLVPPQDHAGDAALASLYGRIANKTGTLPGVETVGLAGQAPLSGHSHCGSFHIRGRKKSRVEQDSACRNRATGAYFDALDIPILRGRNFGPQDTRNGRPAVIIDKHVADAYFPNSNPVGQQIDFGDGDGWVTIIGVVPHVRWESLSGAGNRKMVYRNSFQHPARDMHLVLKTRVPPALVAHSLTVLLHDVDPAVAVYGIETMQQRLGEQLQSRRATMYLVIAFGVIALVLAMVGVYGVLSYAIGQRTAEFGVRLALGALPRDLLWLIIQDGLKLLIVGLAAGLALAVAIGFAISSQLFGVQPFDPLTLFGAALVLSIVTLLASYLPARRAAKLDPAIAMMEQ